MNKLVSKNPVQRFKQGRKIEKYGLGDAIVNFLSPSGEYVTNGKFDFNKWLRSPQTNGVTPGGQKISQQNSFKTPELTGSKEAYLNRLQQQGFTAKETPLVKTKKEKSRKTSITPSVFAGHRIGRTGGLNYNINDADKQQLIGTGQFTESDFTNALSAQQALNRYFANSGLGSVTEDGAWGDQSRAALTLALSKSKSLTPFNNETTAIKTPILPAYTPSTTSDLKIKNVPTYIDADRSQTRDWMRSNGINPYSVTGAMRAAARKIRAGQANDNDKLLVKGNEQLYNLLKDYYKQGGQLPSRNIVERFKQRNFRSVAQ